MNPERFDALQDAWAESRLTPTEAAELSAQLRRDSAARTRFQEAAIFNAQLHAALDSLSLEQALGSARTSSFRRRNQSLGLAALLGAAAVAAVSLGWLLSARANNAQTRPLGIQDGGFETIRGSVPSGFPRSSSTWSGDPSEVASADPSHPTALRFIEAAGEPNVPNSPQQSCDVFQVIDLSAVRGELENSGEAFVELQASFLDARSEPAKPVRFISKVYVFEGSPEHIADLWPPATDQTLGSGAQFHVSSGGDFAGWKTLKTRCVLPPGAGFLVVQIGAGSAGRPGQPSPELGAQFADDIRLTLHTRPKREALSNR